MIKTKSSASHARPSNGLSLIEVCLAIAILAVIFANLSFIFNQGYLFLRKTRLSRQAFFLAEERMEYLLIANAVNDPDSFNVTPKQPVGAPFEAFQYEVSIKNDTSAVLSCTGGGCGGKLAEVNVTIYWNGTSGEQNFSLVSLVSNAGH